MILPTHQHRLDPFAFNLEGYLVPKLYLGYEAEKLLSEHLFLHREQIFRERCSKIFIALIKDLRKRLPDNVQVLKAMCFKLCVVKNSTTPLLEPLRISADEITKIELQWSNITLVTWREISNTVKFWAEVNSYEDASNVNPYHELSSVALTILSLPHSKAEIERVFSQMNHIKSKLRNMMKTDTINAILHIRYGLKRMSKTCVTYNFPNDTLDLVTSSQKYKQSRESTLDRPMPSTSTSFTEIDENEDEVLLNIMQDLE